MSTEQTFDQWYAEYGKLCKEYDWPCCDQECLIDAYDDGETPYDTLREDMEAT